jgi:acetyl esterase/lipase
MNLRFSVTIAVEMVIAGLIMTSCNCRKNTETESRIPANCIQIIDDIPYRTGESDAWKLDLAIPLNNHDTLFPAIIIVHGGGWRSGSKHAPVYRALLMDYALQGYVTVSVEYRLIGEAPFPACIQDVKCAVRWLRAHAKDYHVNPDRIGAFGHSAGAHLVMMLAMSSNNNELEGDGGWTAYSSKVSSAVVGSTPTQMVPRISDNLEWWPVNYISAGLPPILIIHGSKDEIVPVESADDFVKKLKQAGNEDITYLKIEDGNHGVAYEFNLDLTRPAMDAFFERTVKK